MRLSRRLRAMVRDTVFGPQVLEGMARVGHATHGVVYFFLGILATAAALSKTRPPSLAGAFSIVDYLPVGWLLLLAVALGLCTYAAWRVIQALLDLQRCGWGVQGLMRRAGMVIEAVVYAGIGVLAVVIAVSRTPRIAEEVREEPALAAWTAWILEWPLGHWIIGFIGLGAIGMGCGQLMKARRIAFEDIRAGAGAMVLIRIVGRIGFAAKGAIFGVIGMLLLLAAWQVEASAAGGMRAALTFLADVPLGDPVLLAVSVGLVLYGVFSLIVAWCHKPVTP